MVLILLKAGNDCYKVINQSSTLKNNIVKATGSYENLKNFALEVFWILTLKLISILASAKLIVSSSHFKRGGVQSPKRQV